MSTTITPTEQNIEINVNNDVIDINVTNEIVDVNATTQQIDINVAGAYPIPNPVLSVFGRTGVVVATEGDYTLTQLGDVTLSSPSNGQVLKYNGTAWVNGTDAGGLTSVGLSMPTAFTVTNSPLTANGTIAVTGAGNATQYVRGDGALATLPTNGGGGGASVSYYLNGSVNQGTLGGVTYYEMNKTPIIGAGTDFTRSSNGYIASFLTDANDPALLNIPAGNFNFETYFEASSGGGSPTFYIELYKYDGTTFTLIASNSTNPKLINDGTNIEAYFSALAVPQTTLTLTDRLAIRIYVTTSGRTITLHTENSNLCQVITTFTTGLTALNGLTAQVQYLATGTSGTDFNISSATATHTFNLPTASATNRGALSSADWTTFNSKQNALTNPITGTGTSGQVAYFNGTNSITSESNLFWDAINNRLGIGTASPLFTLDVNGTAIVSGQLTLSSTISNGTNTYTLPSSTGTLALTSQIPTSSNYVDLTTNQTIAGNKTFTNTGNFFGGVTTTGIRVGSTSSFYWEISRENVITGYLGFLQNNNGTITERMRLYPTGNLLIQSGGTFTDAGFRLDVNGTARVSGNLQADSLMYFSSTSAASIHLGGVGAGSTYFIIRNFTGVSNSGIQRVNGNNQPVEFFQRGSTTNEYVFRFSSTDGRTMGNGVNGINDYIRIGDFTYNTPTTNNYTGSILNINPTYNITANTGTILRGIYYNPALTSLTGTTHIAFQNTSGDVLLGTTSGNVAIGTSTLATATELTLGGSQTASSAIARGGLINTTLVAAANNDVLVGLDINPTFTNGAFTGVTNLGLRVQADATFTKASGNMNFNVSSVAASTIFFNLNTGTSALSINVRGSGSTGNMGLPANSAEIVVLQKSAFGIVLNQSTYFAIGSSLGEQLRLVSSTGNLLLNTTTDAGFRLDVNGTARVQNTLTVRSAYVSGAALSVVNFLYSDSSTAFNILEGAVKNVTIGGNDIFCTGILNLNNTTTTSATLRISSFNFRLQGNGQASFRDDGANAFVNSSAQIEIVSTTRGFLPPRMTTTQKNAISSPATGLVVYDTTLNQMSYYNGTTWTNI